MEKTRRKLADCSDKDIIAADIYSDTGIFIVPAKTQINEYIKEKLEGFGIDCVDVFVNCEPECTPNEKQKRIELLKKDYCKKIETVKSIFNDLAAGRKLELTILDSIADSFYSNIYDNYEIVECVNKVKDTDQYTYVHCLNVSVYSMFIARWNNFSRDEIKDIIMAGLLHDIGKAKIPPEVLNKRGPLDESEFDLIKKHTIYGYQMVFPFGSLKDQVKKAVLMHHEKENGSGYPLGLYSAEIVKYAKIIAVADIYDALTSKRVYREKLTPFDTFREIEKTAIGTNLYDLSILLPFLANISTYYVGSKIKLSDGNSGEIVYIPPRNISSPVIKVGGEYIDMVKHNDVKIMEII